MQPPLEHHRALQPRTTTHKHLEYFFESNGVVANRNARRKRQHRGEHQHHIDHNNSGMYHPHRATNFRCANKYNTNGAPTPAKTIPTCNSPGRAITRPNISANSTKIAPPNAEYGNNQR